MNCRVWLLAMVLVVALPVWAESGRSVGQSANVGMADARARLPARVLHFPRERPVGCIRVQDENLFIPEICKGFHPGYMYAETEYLGPAQGDVSVPAGRRVVLHLGGYGVTTAHCIEALKSLDPNDVYSLILEGPMRVHDSLMPHIVRLTGLRQLSPRSAVLTPRGWAMLAQLPRLERLDAPPQGLSDAAMAEIARVRSLRMLHLSPGRMTDKSLAAIAGLQSLEVLHLSGSPAMTDEGLKPLADLPSLRYLRLSGPFTDRGMDHLAAIPALRVLCLDPGNITDAGLQRLARSTSIERLNLHWLDKLTDRGIAYLKDMSQLKGLDVVHARLTDAGVEPLATMSNLDRLELPNRGLTDAGIAHLGKLTGLKYLWVGCASNSPLTDESLRVIGGLHGLEELHVSGTRFTGRGIEHIVGLQGLQALHLHSPDLGNDDLKRLARLKNLRSLSWGFFTQTSIAGLRVLAALPALETLHVKQIRQDGTGLDISGLRKLTDLTIGMRLRAREGDRYTRTYDEFRDSDLACLQGLTSLRWLRLNGPGIGDDGLVYLASLTNLEILNIGGSPALTDNGLRCLAGMRKLRSLWIGNSRISEQGLTHLYPLKALDSVRIRSAVPISREALARLRMELPNLQTVEVAPPEPPR